MSHALTQEIDRIRRTCILCGRCTAACPSCAVGGIDPMEIMAGGEEGLDQCIVCGTCSQICRRSDPFTVIRMLIAIERGITVSDAYRDTGFARAPAADRMIEPEWTGQDACLMSGCTVRAQAPYLEHAGTAAMDAVGVRPCPLPDEGCCLHPVQFIGMTEHERRNAKKEMCEGAGDRDVVCICPGCSDELSAVDEGAVDFIQFLDARIGDLPRFKRTVAVAMEPGCSAAPRAKRMRAVLEAMNCRVVNREWGCCGKSAPVAGELMAMRERECEGAEVIVVDGPMCHVKYDAYDGGIPVVHISELVAAAAGRTETLGFHRIPVPDLTGRSRFIE